MIDRTIAPQVHEMGKLSLPRPVTKALDNGVKLHILEGGSQDVSQLNIVWQGGTLDTDIVTPGAKGAPAIARIMASAMCEGTEKYTGAEISELIDFNGAMLKVSPMTHHTVLQLTMLNSLAADVLPVVADIISHAAFPDDKFEKYRDTDIRDYLLGQSNVVVLARQASAPLSMGADHPDALVETPESIGAVTVDRVREYYRRVVVSGGCQAFVSGRVSHGMLADIEKLLMCLPDAPAARQNIVPYSPQAPQRVDVIKPDAMQAAVVAELPAIDRNHPDYVPLRFAVIALGGYFGSRLMKNIREDKGYTYGIASYLMGALEGSTVSIIAQTDAKYVDMLIDEVRAEMRRLADCPPTGDELQAMRQYISSSLLEYLDSPFSIMDYYRTVATVGIPEGYFAEQVELVHTVTPELISTMAAKYLDPAQLRIAVAK